MYAEKTKTGYNLMELSEEEMGAIEMGLSSIHMNTHVHQVAQNLSNQIDQDLNDNQN